MSPIVKAASSDAALVLARLAMLSMPIVIPLMGWLGIQYLDGRFAEVRTAAAEAYSAATTATVLASTTKDQAASLASDVAVIKAGQADQASSINRIGKQVDKLTDVVTTTSNQVSAISATLGAMRSEEIGALPLR